MMDYDELSLIVFYDRKGKILLQNRSREKEESKGIDEKWGFFGGGIEFSESPRQAAVREILEELDYKANDLKPLYKFKKKIDGKYVLTHVYSSPLENKIKYFNLKDGAGMDVVSIDHARKLPMSDISYHILDKLQSRFEEKTYSQKQYV